MKGICIRFLLLFSLIQVSCKGKEILVPPSSNYPNDGSISVYTTNHDGTITLYKKPVNLKFQTKITANVVDIDFDISATKQSMDGFGAALTGSSAYVLMTHLSAAQRAVCLKDLFDAKTGIGLSYLRLSIGASDFSLNNFTYNDMSGTQTDTAMLNFSIAAEESMLIPVLKEIIAINPNIKIMASPWSAPAWMKSNKSLTNGGSVNYSYFNAYAKYFVKYIKAFQTNGIQIDAITIQNEPLYAAPYMSTEMSATAQADFIKTALGPAFEANNISTKILIYDHNWDHPDYPIAVLGDADARKYIAGTAFHCYAGSVLAMTMVTDKYPDKGLYFTECSGGDWAPDFGGNLAWNAENLLIGAPRNGAKNVLFWNLALDENRGPKNNGCGNCRGVIGVNSSTKIIDKNVEYYILGHSSKFVNKDAKLIQTLDTRSQGISQVAYLNTDGTKVLVAYNHLSTTQKIQVNIGAQSFSYDIEAGAMVSFTW